MSSIQKLNLRSVGAAGLLFSLATLASAGCTFGSVPGNSGAERQHHGSDISDGAEIQDRNDIADPASDSLLYLAEQDALDAMRREVLNISANDAIDYELLASVEYITIHHQNQTTVYFRLNPGGDNDRFEIPHHIVDISYAMVFPNLRSLDARNLPVNEIPDLSPLENLQDIHFVNSGIKSLSGLEGVKSLTHFSIHRNDGNRIENLDILADFPLRSLVLQGCAITDSDLEFLKAGGALTDTVMSLSLYDNNLTCISMFAYLENLNDLNVANNKISELYLPEDSLLSSKNTRGMMLNFSGNSISSLRGISSLRIDTLFVARNQITLFDIENEELVFTLLDLDISDNRLENLDGIVNLRNLMTLDIRGNENLDLSQLEEAAFTGIWDLFVDQYISPEILARFGEVIYFMSQVQDLETP